jgi:hypothetical protein
MLKNGAWKMNKELIEEIGRKDSTAEFWKLKQGIEKALGKSKLAKKISVMESQVDFYALKEEITKELEKPVKEVE